MSRVTLVTGGTRGIGRACSIALKDAGYRVAANYGANEEAARAFTEEIGIPVYKWDVGNGAACEEGVAKIEAEHGPIEVLVHNAGISPDRFMHKMPAETWQRTINTNLDSCFHLCHAIVPGMRRRRWGRIVMMSSMNAFAGAMGETHYDSTKAGMIGFARALARESAALGITVNAVAPGYIDTDMIAPGSQEWREATIAEIPVGRLGTGQDVAHCVVFLAAEHADYITGSVLAVNGGLYMH